MEPVKLKLKKKPGITPREILVNAQDVRSFLNDCDIVKPAEKMIPLWSPKTHRKMLFKESEVPQYVEEGFLETDPDAKKEGK